MRAISLVTFALLSVGCGNGIGDNCSEILSTQGTPFESLATTLTGSHTFLTQTLDTSLYSRTAPAAFRTITVSGQVDWNTASYPALFIYADDLIFETGSVLNFSGHTAVNQDGAVGASGGGGGEGTFTGSFGGSGGTAGGDGIAGSGGTSPGALGPGRGVLYVDSHLFGAAGRGGDGGDGGLGGEGAGGAAADTWGGGGGAGGSNAGPSLPGGGGGGGGLIVLVARKISGPGTLQVNGGEGGPGPGAGGGGGGGGGVIWVSAGSYDGQLSAQSLGGPGGSPNGGIGSDGTQQIFQECGTRLKQHNFSDRW